MKKNITINLFGQLYHIDEDAYELLHSYEENMRRYFLTKEGGEEIIDDIEHRVAELLTDLETQGVKAISIEHIQEIILRIGNPEQIGETSDENPPEDLEEEKAGNNFGEDGPPPYCENKPTGQQIYTTLGQRRLFRDLKDAMLGGVSSGLAHYFGINDPIFIRIAWVLLLFFPYFPAFIIYVILWIIVPPAITPEQRLQMYGRPVTPNNLNEEIIQASQPNTTANAFANSKSTFHRIANVLLNGCAIAFKVLVVSLLVLFLFATLCALISLIAFTFGFHGIIFDYDFVDPQLSAVVSAVNSQIGKIWLLALTGMISLGLPLYILCRKIFTKDKKFSSNRKRIGYISLWLISLVTTIFLGFSTTVNIGLKMKEHKEKIHTRNGVCLYGRGWGILEEGNWNVIKLENANRYIYGHCPNLFHGDSYRYYIDINGYDGKNGNAMKGTLQRDTDVEPGIYQLEAIVRPQGEGCYLYAQSGAEGKVSFTAIPFNNDSLYQIKNIGWEKAETCPYFKNRTDSTQWEKVQERSRDRNWCYVTSETFEHSGGVLIYGITNDSKFTKHPWNGNSFEIYEVVLTRISDLHPKDTNAEGHINGPASAYKH